MEWDGYGLAWIGFIPEGRQLASPCNRKIPPTCLGSVGQELGVEELCMIGGRVGYRIEFFGI